MLLDVPICTCIEIQLSGVIMIGSITLKCRFGEELWSNLLIVEPTGFSNDLIDSYQWAIKAVQLHRLSRFGLTYHLEAFRRHPKKKKI